MATATLYGRARQLSIRDLPCGCVEVTSTCGHDSWSILEAASLTPFDVLCARHRHELLTVDEPPKIRRALYRLYLQSEVWAIVRQAAIDEAGERCAMCAAGGPLQGHHRTYARIGCEAAGDVIAICRECHARHHGRRP